MSIPYTYWPAEEGGFIGYWNDYPEYVTEGETIQELEFMLRDIRDAIQDGDLRGHSALMHGAMEYA